ncbi:MAG: fimbria major subunit, partial [Mucinivorans sp.]
YTVVKHKTIAKSYLFFNQDDFATWKTNNAEEAKKYESTGVKYTKGENYYLVKIVHDAAVATHKFSVLRNNIYEVTLKNVNAFGSNESGTIVTPGDPIETNVWIEATITLAPWTVKSQTSDLE